MGLTCHSKITGMTLTVRVTVREPGHKSGQTFPLEFFSFSKEHTAGDRNASRETGDL